MQTRKNIQERIKGYRRQAQERRDKRSKEVCRLMTELWRDFDSMQEAIGQEFGSFLKLAHNLHEIEKAGVEIKINNRLHARFLVAYDIVQEDDYTKYQGLVLIGSFDFNTECLGRERYDAGIKTRNPDLVKSTVELFEQIWNEPESIPLKDFIKK